MRPERKHSERCSGSQPLKAHSLTRRMITAMEGMEVVLEYLLRCFFALRDTEVANTQRERKTGRSKTIQNKDNDDGRRG